MHGKLSARVPFLTLACLLIGTACDAPPVAWDASGPADTVQVIAPAGRGAPPAEPGMCRASIRFAGGPTVWWAAWWTARPDSGVVPRVARSADGGAHWDTPIMA